MLMRTKKGCFIDVEVQVADGYGYDIQCEVVCENGTVKLPDPYAVVCRSRPMRLGQREARRVHAHHDRLEGALHRGL